MKILITGCTATQVASQKRIVKFTSYPEIYGRMLEKAGHHVTFRPVTPGEGLKEFSRVIIGLAPVNALNTRHMFGALWALHLLDRGDIRGIVQMDDWNYRATFSGARSMSKDFETRLYKKEMLLRDYKEMVRDVPKLRKPIEHMIAKIGNSFSNLGQGNVKVIAPLFETGNHRLMINGTSLDVKQILPIDVLGGYDWKALQRKVSSWDTVKRRRAWIHAALPSNKGFSEKIKSFKWPIEEYGPNAPDKRKLKEDELIRQYWDVEGLIAMPYYHSGSGWVRARFMHAAITKTVIGCDPKEGIAIGPSYTNTMDEIEKMKQQQLRELASAQAKDLQKLVWPEKRLIDSLDTIMRKI